MQIPRGEFLGDLVMCSDVSYCQVDRMQTHWRQCPTKEHVAQKVLQRRKSRSGRSLELHARTIFIEEGLRENQAFAYNQESEPGHKPDFLFPSAEAYRTTDFPSDRLRMLAVKTTCHA